MNFTTRSVIRSTNRAVNPNTHRAYASAIDRTVAVLGAGRLLATVTDDEVGAALTQLWGGCAPATWNRNRAALLLAHLVRDEEAVGGPIGAGRCRTAVRTVRTVAKVINNRNRPARSRHSSPRTA